MSKSSARIVKIGGVDVEGVDGLTGAEIEALVQGGARFVFFEYCISFLIFSLRKPSAICFVRPEEWGWVRGLPYTILSLILGWWGLPWGVIYTPIVLVNNMAGGCDVTTEVCAALQPDSESAE